MSDSGGPAPGYSHFCIPIIHHCWETCGYRLHHGHGADADWDYVRWEDRLGKTVRGALLDDRTYADFDAEGRVIGVGFRHSHGPDGCRHPEGTTGHIERPGTPFYGPLADAGEQEHEEDCEPVPAALGITLMPEDGGIVGWAWPMESTEQAMALREELTARFGEPQETAADQAGFAHSVGVFRMHAITPPQ